MEETKHIIEIVKREIPNTVVREAADWAKANLMRTLESKFDNVYGKKAQQFAQGKSFVFKRDDYHVMYQAVYDTIYCGYKLSVSLLYHIKTQMGKVYIIYTNPYKYDCYTAHYFDRYAERMGIAKDRNEAINKRDDALKAWCSKAIVSMRDHVEVSTSADGTETAYDYHPDGMGLGLFEGDIVLFKTFVSNDMLRQNQIRTGEKITKLPSALEKLRSIEFR